MWWRLLAPLGWLSGHMGYEKQKHRATDSRAGLPESTMLHGRLGQPKAPKEKSNIFMWTVESLVGVEGVILNMRALA